MMGLLYEIGGFIVSMETLIFFFCNVTFKGMLLFENDSFAL